MSNLLFSVALFAAGGGYWAFLHFKTPISSRRAAAPSHPAQTKSKRPDGPASLSELNEVKFGRAKRGQKADFGRR